MALQRKNSKSSYLELDELITRVLCDTAPPRGRADAVYLFGETSYNEASVIEVGALLWRLGRVKKVLIDKWPPANGYSGFDSWRKKLVAKGVRKNAIEGFVQAKDFPPSTDAEATGLVRLAKTKNFKKIYLTAPPLHQLRAFVSTVSAIIREKSKLLVYSFPGFPQRWEEHIVHSQGILKGTRSELLGVELQKINRYYEKGDMVSAEEVLEYLNRRDRK